MKLSTDKIPYKKQIKDIADTLNGNIYFVGGTVRDLLLQRPINDIDIVVFNVSYGFFAEQIKAHLKASSVNFKDNVRIVKNATIIDVSKPRGHTIIEDLKLRDFTINSMALDLDGNLINFTEDIKNKYIIIQYNNAFLDDPLRMLRAFRLASELNFTIQKDTIDKILQNNNLIKKVAKERIYDELYKTFTAVYFNKIYELFIESQLYHILLDIKYDITSKKFTAKCLDNYFNNCLNLANNRFLHIIIFLTIYHFITNKNTKNFILEKLKKIIIVKKHLIYISKILYLLDMLLNIKISNNRLNHLIFENISFIPDILFFLTIIGKSNLDKSIDRSINCENLYNKIYCMYNSYNIDRINEITGNDLKVLNIPDGLIFGKLLRRAQYYLVSRKCSTKEEALQKIKKIWEVIHEIY